MGSSMSSYPANLLSFFRNVFNKRSLDEEYPDCTVAPSDCKQRRIDNTFERMSGVGVGGAIVPPYTNIPSESSVTSSLYPSDAFLSIKSSSHSMRKNKHTVNLPAAGTKSQPNVTSAPSLYPYTNGHHLTNQHHQHQQQQQQQHQQMHHLIGGRLDAGRGYGAGGVGNIVSGTAKSGPPQLLPARSRFSRVPPSLLPINGSSSSALNATGAAATTSSYGLNGTVAPRSGMLTVGSTQRNRLLCSTPKCWPGGAGASTDLSLRRSVLVDANPTALDFSAINGVTAATTSASATNTTTAGGGVGRQALATGATRSIAALSSIPTFREVPSMDYSKYAELLRNLKVDDREIYSNPMAVRSNVAERTALIDLCNEDTTIIDSNQKADQTVEPESANNTLPPINSFQISLDSKPVYQSHYVDSVTKRYSSIRKSRDHQLQHATATARQSHDATTEMEQMFKRRLNIDWLVPTAPIVTPDDEPEPAEPEPLNEFPAFSGEQSAVINNALRRGGDAEALITRFSITIRRSDIQTLTGLSWLNDEVINFYMNLLMERSERRAGEGLPKVYAFNTFFLTRLSGSGHAGVRRWTRKVDIFSYDLIPVPVHVGGVHWCMAMIDFRRRTIRYYDSMISKNPNVLQMLANYLVEEGRDKKGTPYDVSDWTLESMCDIPRQNNQSDCGVFSCAFAETLTRGAPVRFSQQNMPWMRMKMVLEICTGELLL